MAKLMKWIVNLVLLCAIAIAAALLIPPLAGVTTAIIDNTETQTNLEMGSVTYAKATELKNIDIGDDVLVVTNNSDHVYRVRKLDTGDGTATLEDTKQGSGTVDFTFSETASKVIMTVPLIGYVSWTLQNPLGVVIILAGVVLLILLFILSELWRPEETEEEVKNRKRTKKFRKKKDEEEVTTPQPQTKIVAVDSPSSIMEEVSDAIASEVSSVVANGGVGETGKSYATQKAEMGDDLRKMEQLLWLEAGETGPVNPADKAVAGETVIVKDLEELGLTAEETKASNEEAGAVDSSADDGMMTTKPMDSKLVQKALQSFDSEKLIQEAKEKGGNPEVSKGEDDVTFVDYSKLL